MPSVRKKRWNVTPRGYHKTRVLLPRDDWMFIDTLDLGKRKARIVLQGARSHTPAVILHLIESMLISPEPYRFNGWDIHLFHFACNPSVAAVIQILSSAYSNLLRRLYWNVLWNTSRGEGNRKAMVRLACCGLNCSPCGEESNSCQYWFQEMFYRLCNQERDPRWFLLESAGDVCWFELQMQYLSAYIDGGGAPLRMLWKEWAVKNSKNGFSTPNLLRCLLHTRCKRDIQILLPKKGVCGFS